MHFTVPFPPDLDADEKDEFGRQLQAFIDAAPKDRGTRFGAPLSIDFDEFMRRWQSYLQRRRWWRGFVAAISRTILALVAALRLQFFPTLAEQRQREKTRRAADRNQAEDGEAGDQKSKREEGRETEKASNPFDLLGITRTEETTEKHVDRAFKKAALKFHPDRVSRGTEAEKEAAHEMMQRLNIARGECLRIIVADRSAQRRKRRAERRRRRDGNDESDSGGEEDESDLSESEPEYDEDLGDDDDDDEEEERRREQAAGYAEFEREQERKFDEMLRGMREEERRVRAEQRKASERAELRSRGFSPWDTSTGGKRGGKKNKKNNKNNKNKAKNQKQQRQEQLRQQEAAAEATRAAQAEKTRNGRRGLVPGEPDACLRDAAYENSADDTACAIRLGLGEGGCHGESIWLSFHPPYSFLSPLPMGGGGRDSSSSSSSSSNPSPLHFAAYYLRRAAVELIVENSKERWAEAVLRKDARVGGKTPLATAMDSPFWSCRAAAHPSGVVVPGGATLGRSSFAPPTAADGGGDGNDPSAAAATAATQRDAYSATAAPFKDRVGAYVSPSSIDPDGRGDDGCEPPRHFAWWWRPSPLPACGAQHQQPPASFPNDNAQRFAPKSRAHAVAVVARLRELEAAARLKV
jgi:hypothetical protein